MPITKAVEVTFIEIPPNDRFYPLNSTRAGSRRASTRLLRFHALLLDDRNSGRSPEKRDQLFGGAGLLRGGADASHTDRVLLNVLGELPEQRGPLHRKNFADREN